MPHSAHRTNREKLSSLANCCNGALRSHGLWTIPSRHPVFCRRTLPACAESQEASFLLRLLVSACGRAWLRRQTFPPFRVVSYPLCPHIVHTRSPALAHKLRVGSLFLLSCLSRSPSPRLLGPFSEGLCAVLLGAGFSAFPSYC